MRKLLLIVIFIVALTATVFADDSETILVGEKSPIVVPAGAVCESDNEKIVSVKKDMIIGVSPGETDIHIKEKRFLKDKTVEDIHVVVKDDAMFCIKPEEEIEFSPKFELYDASKKKLQDFEVDTNLTLQPGTYYVKENTWYSSEFGELQKIDLAAGERKNLSVLLQEPAEMKFQALDEELCGEEVVIWTKESEKKYKEYKTLKIGDNMETEPLKVRSGEYYWEIKGDKIKSPVTEPVEYEKHKLYPFAVSGNPLTITVSSSMISVVTENVSFNQNAAANAQVVYERLTGTYGCPPTAACAIIGNMYGESGIRTYALEKGGGGGHGLCQWTGGRWDNLRSYANSKGKDWTNIDVQIDFLMKELSEMKNMNEFWYAETVDEATEIFMRKFERPASWVYATSLPKRIGAAKAAMQAFVPQVADPAQQTEGNSQ